MGSIWVGLKPNTIIDCHGHRAIHPAIFLTSILTDKAISLFQLLHFEDGLSDNNSQTHWLTIYLFLNVIQKSLTYFFILSKPVCQIIIKKFYNEIRMTFFNGVFWNFLLITVFWFSRLKTSRVTLTVTTMIALTQLVIFSILWENYISFKPCKSYKFESCCLQHITQPQNITFQKTKFLLSKKFWEEHLLKRALIFRISLTNNLTSLLINLGWVWIKLVKNTTAIFDTWNSNKVWKWVLASGLVDV